MITDLQLQHELLKTALEATDNYLTVEKKAVAAGKANDDMVHDFSFYMSAAHDALQSLGVLDQHQEYMKTHVDTMLKLLGHRDTTIGDLPYAHVPKADIEDVSEQNVWDKPSPVKKHEKLSSQAKAKAKARAKAAGRPYPNMVDNIWAARNEDARVPSFSSFITEEKVEDTIPEDEIDSMVEHTTWEDIYDLYPEEDLIHEDVMVEALSAQARLKKRQAFARNRSRRNIAKGLKLARASSPEILKKRAVAAARRALYKRLLRGRDKATLSASEKNRIEQQVSKMKSIQQTIVNKMLPKVRSIEQSRLAHKRGAK
jgi:hypothetical protein